MMPPATGFAGELSAGVCEYGAGDNNPCCDWWRDPLTRTPSPRLGSYFGGAHTGGMNAVMADGSVRTISWTVSQTTFANLGNRMDGNAVTE